MSNGFLRALAKVKLVELDEPAPSSSKTTSADPADDPEIQRMVAEAERAEAQQSARKGKPGAAAAPARAPADARRAPAPARAAGAQPSGGSASEIAEGKPFDAYYEDAGVPSAPYPAEKLLRLLDGLRAMDAGTRKSAVIAMDTADDNWAIADVVLDAQRKVRTLAQVESMLKEQLSQIVERTRQEKQKRDEYLAAATAQFRAKIAEYEQGLEKAIADVAAEKAQLDAQAQAAEAAFQRESVRIGAEQQRLAEIPTTFVIDRPAG